MMLNPEQALLLSRIYDLSQGTTTNPATIGALHGTYFHLDVRDLVADLRVLVRYGLIENAGETREEISNTVVMTPEGIAYHSGNAG
jgi:hypothetical protein